MITKMTEPQIGFTGLPDADALVLLELPYSSLIRTCQSSRYLYSICQDPHFWKQKIIKDYGSQVLHYMSEDDSYFRFYDLLTKIPQYFNLNVLGLRFPDESLENFLNYLTGRPESQPTPTLISRRVQHRFIKRFDELMREQLTTGESRIIDASRLNIQKYTGSGEMSNNAAQRYPLIRPWIMYQGRQIHVPVVVRPDKKLNLVDFLNRVVPYSRYSDFLPEMLQSIQ